MISWSNGLCNAQYVVKTWVGFLENYKTIWNVICRWWKKKVTYDLGFFSFGFVNSDMKIMCWLCNADRRRQAGQSNCSRRCPSTFVWSLCSPYWCSSWVHEVKHIIAPTQPTGFVLTGPAVWDKETERWRRQRAAEVRERETTAGAGARM